MNQKPNNARYKFFGEKPQLPVEVKYPHFFEVEEDLTTEGDKAYPLLHKQGYNVWPQAIKRSPSTLFTSLTEPQAIPVSPGGAFVPMIGKDSHGNLITIFVPGAVNGK